MIVRTHREASSRRFFLLPKATYVVCMMAHCSSRSAHKLGVSKDAVYLLRPSRKVIESASRRKSTGRHKARKIHIVYTQKKNRKRIMRRYFVIVISQQYQQSSISLNFREFSATLRLTPLAKMIPRRKHMVIHWQWLFNPGLNSQSEILDNKEVRSGA